MNLTFNLLPLAEQTKKGSFNIKAAFGRYFLANMKRNSDRETGLQRL